MPFSQGDTSWEGTERWGMDWDSVAMVGGRCSGALTAVGLILAVFTVVLLVTRPAHGDAAPAGAGEVIQGASGALHSWGEREA